MDLRVCAVLFAVLGHAIAAEILVLHPIPFYSHTVPFKPVFKELARRGHNITIITPFVEDPTPEGFTQIRIKLDVKQLREELYDKNAKQFNGLVYETQGSWPLCRPMSPLIGRLLKPYLPHRNSKFDLLVIEPFFCQEFILGLSYYYNAPVVATLPQTLTPAIAAALGNPDFPSYIPHFRLSLTSDMSFIDRAYNTWISLVEQIGDCFYHLPYQDKVMRELFDDAPDLPYIGDLFMNISLLLTLTHFSLDYHRPLLKNVLEVGGLSLDDKNTLPKDLEKFINESSGVVYFSWGSHYEEDDESILPALMATFSRLKERVIFKWHDLKVPNKPDNVLVKTWIPQTALLSNQKLKLFISHCGLNSLHEAAYYGVPLVATPQFGDQPHNSKLIEHFGLGVIVQPEQLTDNVSLLAGIKRVLSDPSFRANAERRSRMFKDRPVPAAEEAAYWIEYILKYGGDALKPPSASMPWYTLALFDVYAFLLGLVLVLILGVKLCMSHCKQEILSVATDIQKKNK